MAAGVTRCAGFIMAGSLMVPQLGRAQVPKEQAIVFGQVSLARHDRSLPLGSLPIAKEPLVRTERERPVGRAPRPPWVPWFIDPIRQDVYSGLLSPIPATGFDGAPATFFMPPDPNGDVGPSHYVQMVNSQVLVFDKGGRLLYGPVGTNSLWAGFGGVCESEDSGDGIVLYDPISDRWLISQVNGWDVSAVNGVIQSRECVAVSVSGNPMGSYFRYEFPMAGMRNDYPKLGVWPDAYYATYNMIYPGDQVHPPGGFAYAQVCAMDRAAMLAGAQARQLCAALPTQYASLLPADLDGTTYLPSAGSPNYVAALVGTNSIGIWKYAVNWASPSAALTGPTILSTAAFSDTPDPMTGVPQAGTAQQLEPLGDRLMYRLAYRNFGDHETLIANHTVSTTVSATTTYAIRWYEIRINNQSPTLYQQSTYAPDSDYRFMGSAAMDGSGNIALGYTLSSNTRYPEMHYTGRLAIDPPNLMSQGENTAIASAGPQLPGFNANRWGDYSMMAVDPVDECTFWYTSQYQPAAGVQNWKTRVQSFKLPGCPGNWFSLSATPATTNSTTSITLEAAPGFSGVAVLSASGVPAGAPYSFSPASIGAGQASTLSLGAGTSLPGNYLITVTAIEGTVSRTVSVIWSDPGCSGLAYCGGACVNLATDPSNCGACGNVCSVGSTCSGGSCSAPACPSGYTFCDPGCAKPPASCP